MGSGLDDWIYWQFFTLNYALLLIYPLHKSLGHAPFSSLYSQLTQVQFSQHTLSYSGTSLYSRGSDHIENTFYYCTDVIQRYCVANSSCAYCYSRVFRALLPSIGYGADHIENISSVAIIVLPSN
jgi:hypothetical protein